MMDLSRAGDPEARRRLIGEGGELARLIARQKLGAALRTRIDSTDISQSVVRDLIGLLDDFDFRGEPAWRAFLSRMVENKIRAKADYFTAARRDISRERDIDRATPDLAGTDRGPAEMALMREEAERIRDALDGMPTAEREVLVLRFFEGLPHAEIARRMGRPSEAAVHKLYARALKRLARYLGEKS